MRLAKLCEGKLDQAEQKVNQLVGIGGEGPTLAPFTADE
jgi:exonuclease VII small subunit